MTVQAEKLQNELSNGDENIRLAAVRGLLSESKFDPSTIPLLIRLITEHGMVDESIAVRYYAKKAYDRLQGLQRRPDLAILLPSVMSEKEWDKIEEAPELVYGTGEYWLYELNSVDFKIRVKAIIELCNHPQPALFDRLLAMFDTEEHEHVIATLVKYVAHYKRPELLDKTLPYLDHPDARVRANTIEGIGILGDDRAVPDVRPLLKDPDNRVRANAAKYLVALRPDEVRATLAEMLASDEEWMRDSAVYLLGKLPVPEAEALLLEAVKDPSLEIGRKALAALGEMATSGSTIRELEKKANSASPLSEMMEETASRIRARIAPSKLSDNP